MEDILCLGVSVQRATFITFDKVTGRPFHQLITWKDCRGDELVEKFNQSFVRKSLNVGATILYWITRSNKFKQLSRFRLHNNFVIVFNTAVAKTKPELNFYLFCATGYTETKSHFTKQQKTKRSSAFRPRSVWNR